MSNPWDSVLPSVVTTVITSGLLWVGARGIPRIRDRRRYAFSLELGMGPVWYLRKLHRPIATDVTYRIMKKDLSEREIVLTHDEIDPSVSGYGIWNIEEGDTFEIYWKEKGRDYSTFQMIHPGERSIRLRRENTGH